MEQQLLAYSPSMPRMLPHKQLEYVNYIHSDSQAQIKLAETSFPCQSCCYHHISLLLFKLSLKLGLCWRRYLKGGQVITATVLRSWRTIIFTLKKKKEGAPGKSYLKNESVICPSLLSSIKGHTFISVNMLIALSLSLKDNAESLALLVQLRETVTELHIYADQHFYFSETEGQ